MDAVLARKGRLAARRAAPRGIDFWKLLQNCLFFSLAQAFTPGSEVPPTKLLAPFQGASQPAERGVESPLEGGYKE